MEGGAAVSPACESAITQPSFLPPLAAATLGAAAGAMVCRAAFVIMRLALITCLSVPTASLRVPSRQPAAARCHRLRMGLLDGVQSAADSAADGVRSVSSAVQSVIEDEDLVPDGFVRARHILFLEDAEADGKAAALKARIEAGEITFDEAALRFSSCPTRDLRGDLGTFASLSRLAEGTLRGGSLPYDGQDVAPFDALLHAPATELNAVHTVRTQWGTHLVLIEQRGRAASAAQQQLDQVHTQAASLVGRAVGGGGAGADGVGRSGGKKAKAAKSKRAKKKKR